MTDPQSAGAANALVEQLAQYIRGTDHSTSENQRALLERAIASANLGLIRWERTAQDEAVVYDIGITAGRCHKITVAFSRNHGAVIDVIVRAVHGSIESGVQFLTTTTNEHSLREAVGAAHIGTDRGSVHFAVHNGFANSDPLRPEAQLVNAITEIARTAVASPE